MGSYVGSYVGSKEGCGVLAAVGSSDGSGVKIKGPIEGSNVGSKVTTTG